MDPFKESIGPIAPLGSGIGIIIFIAGLILLIIGMILLIRALMKDWEVSVVEFNRKFARKSSMSPADVELDSRRKKIAEGLMITEGVDGDDLTGTEVLDETFATETLTGRGSYDETEDIDKTEEL